MAEWLSTATSLAGPIMKGLGSGIQFGSGLGKVKNAKRLNKAADMMISAGQKDATAALRRGEIQAQVDTSNAYAANFEAAQAEALAAQEAAYIRKEARRQAGAQRAAGAGSGADLDAGVLSVITEDLADMEAAAYRAIYAGQLQSRTLRQQSEDFLTSAEYTRQTAKSQAEQEMASAALRAHQLRQQRKQETVDGLGGMLNGAMGIFSSFSGIMGKGGSTKGSRPGGALDGIFGGLFGSKKTTSTYGGGMNDFNLDF